MKLRWLRRLGAVVLYGVLLTVVASPSSSEASQLSPSQDGDQPPLTRYTDIERSESGVVWIAHGSGIVYEVESLFPSRTSMAYSLTEARAHGGIVAIDASGGGMRGVSPDGEMFVADGAASHGSLPSLGVVPRGEIVDLAAHPSGDGYWMAGDDGAVFAFGAAQFFGSIPQLVVQLEAPIKAIVATPSGNGYWLLGADGGVFAFGDASFSGSISAVGAIVTPAASMAASSELGYWVVEELGRTHAFGGAGEFGDYGPPSWAQVPVSGAVADGDAYLLLLADGRVLEFGRVFFE